MHLKARDKKTEQKWGKAGKKGNQNRTKSNRQKNITQHLDKTQKMKVQYRAQRGYKRFR